MELRTILALFMSYDSHETFYYPYYNDGLGTLWSKLWSEGDRKYEELAEKNNLPLYGKEQERFINNYMNEQLKLILKKEARRYYKKGVKIKFKPLTKEPY